MAEEQVTNGKKNMALTEEELEAAVGGVKSWSSGKWIVTDEYSCAFFLAKQDVDPKLAGTRKCRYCEFMGKENVIVSVCNNPINT